MNTCQFFLFHFGIGFQFFICLISDHDPMQTHNKSIVLIIWHLFVFINFWTHLLFYFIFIEFSTINVFAEYVQISLIWKMTSFFFTDICFKSFDCNKPVQKYKRTLFARKKLYPIEQTLKNIYRHIYMQSPTESWKH